MPIYEYHCVKCNINTEDLRSMYDKDKPAECVNCQGEALLIVSPTKGVVRDGTPRLTDSKVFK